MHTFDVAVWEDSPSDGPACHGALGACVPGAWGQGKTQAAALADITAAMTDVVHHPRHDGKSLAEYQKADAETARLTRQPTEENVSYRVHQVSIPAEEPASV